MIQEDLSERFTTLINFINQAITRTQDGKAVDLGNLNREVDNLCQDAKKASPETMPEVKEKMAELINLLDELSNKLIELRNRHLNS